MNFYDRIYTLLLEYKDEGGKFKRGKSSLTPQQHNMQGNVDDKEAHRNFLDMLPSLKKAHKEGGELWYGQEGGVKNTKVEKLVSRYAKRFGIKMSGGSLEHPDYDPEIKGNKGEKLAAKKHGKDAARRGMEAAFSSDPKKRDNEKAYAQSDYGAKKPSVEELVQRLINSYRRRGAEQIVKDQQKKGRIVVGTYGAGHFEIGTPK